MVEFSDRMQCWLNFYLLKNNILSVSVFFVSIVYFVINIVLGLNVHL